MSEDYTFTKVDNKKYNISRYRNNNIITDSAGIKYMDIPVLKEIPLSDKDKYHMVMLEEEDRIDVLALNFYNNFKYWWVIAHANNMIDPFTVPAGTILRIPSLETLYGTDGILL